MIGTLVSKEPKLTKREDKYYTVKTDIVVEGEEYKVSFNAFNNNDDKHADIVSLLAEGVRIKIEVEKDGKYWNLKSIEPVGPAQETPTTATAVVAASPGGTEAFAEKEDRRQVFIGWQHTFGKWVGSTENVDDNLYCDMAVISFQIANAAYNGTLGDDIRAPKSVEPPEFDDSDIPF